MKKLLLTLLALSLFSATRGQIQMYSSNPKYLGKFKETETIFILPDIYDTATYEEILKKTWTVTPYRIVKKKDFNPIDFISDKYSFAMPELLRVPSGNGSYNSEYGFYFFIFDMDNKTKELEKFNKKSEKKKKDYNLMFEERIHVGYFMLYPKPEFMKIDTFEKCRIAIFETDSFFNYNIGFLSNYIQQINFFITTGSPHKLYESYCTSEIKKLKHLTLYIPSYITIKYEKWSKKPKPLKEINGLLDDYKYKHAVLDADEISKKIIAGEEFYYVRYVRKDVSTNKFVEVVNSRTGEIIYSVYYPGLNINCDLKGSHFKDIKKAIDTGKV